jgi:hypothetical protein
MRTAAFCLALLVSLAARGTAATFANSAYTVVVECDTAAATIKDYAALASAATVDDLVLHVTVTDLLRGQTYVFPCRLADVREQALALQSTLAASTVQERNTRIFAALVATLNVKMIPPQPPPRHR